MRTIDNIKKDIETVQSNQKGLKNTLAAIKLEIQETHDNFKQQEKKLNLLRNGNLINSEEYNKINQEFLKTNEKIIIKKKIEKTLKKSLETSISYIAILKQKLNSRTIKYFIQDGVLAIKLEGTLCKSLNTQIHKNITYSGLMINTLMMPILKPEDGYILNNPTPFYTFYNYENEKNKNINKWNYIYFYEINKNMDPIIKDKIEKEEIIESTLQNCLKNTEITLEKCSQAFDVLVLDQDSYRQSQGGIYTKKDNTGNFVHPIKFCSEIYNYSYLFNILTKEERIPKNQILDQAKQMMGLSSIYCDRINFIRKELAKSSLNIKDMQDIIIKDYDLVGVNKQNKDVHDAFSILGQNELNIGHINSKILGYLYNNKKQDMEEYIYHSITSNNNDEKINKQKESYYYSDNQLHYGQNKQNPKI